MAVTRYIGDRFISNLSTDTFPTDVLEGGVLYSIPQRVEYAFFNGTWNPVRSGVAGICAGQSGMTIYNMGDQWSGSYNVFNNNDLIGFGFIPANPLPLSKGHFYSNSGLVG